MAGNNVNNNSSDEIDLGQLFRMIGRGFDRIFRGILRLFLYLKKNILILVGLVVLGLAIGYGLNRISIKKLKTEVIVKPQLESKNYLYDAIDEIQANIKSKNLGFFKSLGVDIKNLDNLEITIAPVDDGKISSESEMKFLELLQSFENTDAVEDIVRAELENKSSFNHRITFNYKDVVSGQLFAAKMMDYINTNVYFEELIEIYRSNAQSRIAENKVLLQQVDELISNYSKNLTQDNSALSKDRIVLDNNESIDLTGLFNLKNSLIRDIENRKMLLAEHTDAIKIINFGKPQEVQKTVYGNTIVLIPLILLGGFFVTSILIYLNKESKELHK